MKIYYSSNDFIFIKNWLSEDYNIIQSESFSRGKESQESTLIFA